MNMPFYVAPEQVMKDRADYARKGIARGRSLVGFRFDKGVAICAENTSSTLRKVSEIYDRIAFAGVGKYNEFDQLRIAGVRHADMKGYSFSREDVDARSLANQYAQSLGQIFTHEMKPMEVELVVAELGLGEAANELYRIQYDGTVVDEQRFCVIGGESDAVLERLDEGYDPTFDRNAAIALTVTALAGPDRELTSAELEIAVLEPDNGRRAFKRLDDDEMAAALGVSTSRIYMLSFGFGAAVTGLAGGLLAPITGVLPTIGSIYIAKAFITVISGGSAILAGTSSASVLLGGVNGVFAFLTGPTIGEVALLLAAIVLLRLMPRGITGTFFRKSL